ncbi:MAG: DUF4402 domain-containing protein [Ferruginibacter sp.]
MKKIFLAAIVLTGAAVNANAQAVATATASATIVSPISIAKDADMNFGNLSVSPSAGGTVTMEATAAATRTASLGGGVSLPANTGTVSAAQFTVSGQASFTYDLVLPTTITLVNGANAMTVENFTSSSTGTLDGTGNESFYVGADLIVDAGQAPGVYTTSSPFFVAVNYN